MLCLTLLRLAKGGVKAHVLLDHDDYAGVRIPMDYVNKLFLRDQMSDARIDEAFDDGQW